MVVKHDFQCCGGGSSMRRMNLQNSLALKAQVNKRNKKGECAKKGIVVIISWVWRGAILI